MTISKTLMRSGCALIAALCALSPLAPAQYMTDFESLNGSASGVVLTGQDGYYLPNTTSVDFNVFTYAGNSLGVNPNPNGGSQFISATGPAGGVYGRAQRDFTWGAGTGVWTLGTDLCVTFNGTLPTADNAGSLSIQPFPGSQSFIMLARWTDAQTASNWNADYYYFDSGGTYHIAGATNPGFQVLAVNHWYRWEVDIRFDTNQILALRITDLSTGATVEENPIGWYLEGGAAGGSPTPTGFRFFAGGGVAGNTLSFDNAHFDLRARAIPYGAGLAGTNGRIPTIALTGLPMIGSTPTIDIGNTTGATASGALIIGFSAASFPVFGGTLLNTLDIVQPISITAPSVSLPAPIPSDPNLVTATLYAQGLEVDPGAVQGIAMTQGLEIRIGG